MSARTFPARSDGWCRHRLLVLGTDVGDLVEAAGGFLCDRARAGWDVTVVATGCETSRSLAILGTTGTAAAVDIATALRALTPGAVVAVARWPSSAPPRLRHELARIARGGVVEILAWGRPAQAGPGQGLEPITHPVSAAARAFKGHALTAAGRAPRGEDAEALYRVRSPALRLLCPV
ncbi:hypothetical protein [Mycolicibacterium psychrotolerans]|uniref:hypothetical protein n=1 Tax=Mycolicibacterium psychrotolerans TaxID=216929 RepID=UPI0021F39636|nr:hypothetical protein [Mycolicibacterium psychrotolerans]